MRRWSGRLDHPQLEHRREIIAYRPVLAQPPAGNPVPMQPRIACWWAGRSRRAFPGWCLRSGPGRRTMSPSLERHGGHLETGKLRSEPADRLPGVRRTVHSSDPHFASAIAGRRGGWGRRRLCAEATVLRRARRPLRPRHARRATEAGRRSGLLLSRQVAPRRQCCCSSNCRRDPSARPGACSVHERDSAGRMWPVRVR
jgi:hypothetical protein